MPNEIKYENQVWGEPIAGKRLSTNGYYTGEYLATAIQDKLVIGTTQPHANEVNAVHIGTVLQDALGENPVKVTE